MTKCTYCGLEEEEEGGDIRRVLVAVDGEILDLMVCEACYVDYVKDWYHI